MDVLLIGYGAIAQEVLKHIQPGEDASLRCRYVAFFAGGKTAQFVGKVTSGNST